MQTITIISEKDRLYTALLDGKAIGTLNYPKWYSPDSEITIGGATFSIKGRGFWKTSQDVQKGDEILYEIKTKWRGTIISKIKEPHHFYKLKHQGWFKNGYLLESYKGEEILAVNPVFSWKKFFPGYNVLINGHFDGSESSILLLLISVHLCRAAQNAAITTGS